MISNESDLRERFAQTSTPDIAPPEIATIRRRARQHRTGQALTAAVAAIAVIAAVLAGASLASSSKGSLAPATRIKIHLPEGLGTQWQVAQQDINGKAYRTGSYHLGSTSCVTTTTGGTWCFPVDWPTNETVDYNMSFGKHVATVEGRVPLAARQIVVRLGSQTAVVKPVMTPTTRHFQFFSAWFVHDRAQNPSFRVTDSAGRPLSPPVIARSLSTAQKSDTPAAGHPDDTYSLYRNFNDRLLAYPTGTGGTCLVMAGPHAAGPACSSSHPASAVMLAVALPQGQILLAGTAAPGTQTVEVSQTLYVNHAEPIRIPGDGHNLYWELTFSRFGNGPLYVAFGDQGDNTTAYQTLSSTQISRAHPLIRNAS